MRSAPGGPGGRTSCDSAAPVKQFSYTWSSGLAVWTRRIPPEALARFTALRVGYGGGGAGGVSHGGLSSGRKQPVAQGGQAGWLAGWLEDKTHVALKERL